MAEGLVLVAGSEVDTVVSVKPEKVEVRLVKLAPDIAGNALGNLASGKVPEVNH